MISCEEAAHICNRKQYKEASWRERLQLFLHILACKTCASFSRKNTRLTRLCDKAGLHSLSAKDKEEMKKKIQKES
ncbi:hypothetical protein [Lentiprolixibacter aurantiacus]|uniref:Glycine dehydrogenase n=1 Tax=Lentiprolixibacter aurantiacus TaxID=2993939 RepID=A0AAE3SPM3_9FLAO|nr:hypothetical protein [Lentiprolixibacter aurantiacus]MCX2720720.1 hypothetical protein [Lentiprolixibacter aurantiacus]